TYGRKISLAVGTALMAVSIIAWAFAPTMLLIMVAYVGLAIGVTFLSGAEDAFLYESLQIAGRAADYTRLVGRVNAVMLGAMALGSAVSGLLASITLIAPFLVAGGSLLLTWVVVLTFHEPKAQSDGQVRQSYSAILRQAVAIMRVRPALRYT